MLGAFSLVRIYLPRDGASTAETMDRIIKIANMLSSISCSFSDISAAASIKLNLAV